MVIVGKTLTRCQCHIIKADKSVCVECLGPLQSAKHGHMTRRRLEEHHVVQEVDHTFLNNFQMVEE